MKNDEFTNATKRATKLEKMMFCDQIQFINIY